MLGDLPPDTSSAISRITTIANSDAPTGTLYQSAASIFSPTNDKIAANP